MRQNQAKKALPHFQKAVRLDPKNAHYRYFFGKALALCGKHPEASEQLERAVLLNGSMYQAHMWLAQVSLDLNKPDRARKAARRVLELVPGHRDAKRLLEELDKP